MASSGFHTLKRRFTEFSEDNMSDSAAALTYYGLMAMSPALMALVGIVGLVGNPASTVKTLTQIVTKLGQASSAQTFAGPIKSIAAHETASGALLIVAIVGALYWASSCWGRSCAPRTLSTKRPRADRSGSCARCKCLSPR